MSIRNIVHIDPERCNGCGQCVTACAEGAIQIVDGKARLVSDVYCDGLGACLGHCPQDAITVEPREAEAFDAAAAPGPQHPPTTPATNSPGQRPVPPPATLPMPSAGGCPGLRLASLKRPSPAPAAAGQPVESRLANWPVQLRLIPPGAPFLQGADLLLVGDCVPFAYADFHRAFLGAGSPVAIACPKLDNAEAHVDKLASILQTAGLRSLRVLVMEVPCCHGLIRIAEAAMARAGVNIPLSTVTVGIHGDIVA